MLNLTLIPVHALALRRALPAPLTAPSTRPSAPTPMRRDLKLLLLVARSLAAPDAREGLTPHDSDDCHMIAARILMGARRLPHECKLALLQIATEINEGATHENH